jgi:MFS superfamily sulfate permease-like transporter
MSPTRQTRPVRQREAERHNLEMKRARRYDRRWLPKDVLSGLSVAAIALPVGLAYAELAIV